MFTPVLLTLSLHDALPIWTGPRRSLFNGRFSFQTGATGPAKNGSASAAQSVSSNGGGTPILCRASGTSLERKSDRKSTRLNSSHVESSYAVFCLKKKKKK